MAKPVTLPSRPPRPALTQVLLGMSASLLLGACAPQLPFIPSGGPSPTAASAAPAKQAQEQLRLLVSSQERLYRVAGPLLINNVELCREHARNLLGFSAKNRYSYGDSLAQPARELYGLGETLQVVSMLQDSRAAQAGLRVGDQILAVQGQPFPQGPDAERQAASMLATLVPEHAALSMRVQRANGLHTITVPMTRACGFALQIGNIDTVNAWHDGHRVMLSQGMLGYARSDAELAYVLAKEMAHNILRHAARMNQAEANADIIDNLGHLQPDTLAVLGDTVKPVPQEFDAAADTLSMYMLARAGYPIDGVYRFWQRLAAQHPASNQGSYTAQHPATEHRLAVMEKVLIDVQARQAQKQPLLP